ncbi:MAG: cysteine desulfurase family protein [Candidatus Nanopelagicales bacterium]
MRTYLDHAATTGLLPAARDAMVAHLGRVGNASSLHTSGRAARRVVEESREQIAGALRVRPSEVIFTSGGTEADNLAVKGLWWQRSAAEPARRRVLCAAIEHHAVLDPVHWLGEREGAEVVWLPVDHQGRVSLEALAAELSAHAALTALVTVMAANNEVGTIQPIAAVSGLCREYAVPLHVDAVQVAGAIRFDATLAETTAISAHKLGGPLGVGALLAGREVRMAPLTHGGGQERKIRSGTLDVPAIAGFAAAVGEVFGELERRSTAVARLRDELISLVKLIVPEAILNGSAGAGRLPGNAHFSFPGCEGDALLMLLDAAGIDVSTGSACSAGVPEPSHVLLAMGVDPLLARSSLRFTLGHGSSPADLEAVAEALPAAVQRAKRAGQLRLERRPRAGVS